MDPDLWEICHLYRVLICRKVDKGKKIKDFPMKDRNNAMQKKEIKRRGNMSNSRGKNHYSDRRGGNSSRSYDNKNRY